MYSFNEIVVENGSNTIFKASDRVILESGFKAERGSNFKAYIFECTSGGNFRLGGNNNPENNSNTATNSIVKALNVLIYPNPNTGIFNISMSKEVKAATIEVYDLMGKKIVAKNIETNSGVIDISDYPKGIYMIKVLANQQTFMSKVVYQ